MDKEGEKEGEDDEEGDVEASSSVSSTPRQYEPGLRFRRTVPVSSSAQWVNPFAGRNFKQDQ
ncbi:hypothetical protein FACS189472_18080 [Alphaproteobacteria bacterium]|nr:hypothetical protein FACS189472_18080 [Alphaproteobacteria bacterium]